MSIEFSPQCWAQVRKIYCRWWAGELDRPIVPVEMVGREPGRNWPAAPVLSQATCTELSFPPETLVDRLDHELSQRIVETMTQPAAINQMIGRIPCEY